MSKQTKIKFLGILTIVATLVLGVLWYSINYFGMFWLPKQNLQNQTLINNGTVKSFKSNLIGVSFLYPSDFFAYEDNGTITTSPLSLEDSQMRSSIGIASNLVITFRKNEQLSDSPARNQHGLTDFYEKETTYKGLPALIQSYRGDYAGEKNYIMLIQYNSPDIGNGVLHIRYTEINKDIYENILNSLTFTFI